jgi:hypothetical protein
MSHRLEVAEGIDLQRGVGEADVAELERADRGASKVPVADRTML